MNNDTKPKGKKGKKVGEAKKDVAISASELVVGAETNEFTADARSSIFGNDPTTSGPAAVELLEESEVRIGDRLLSRVEVDKMDKVIADATASAEKEIELRVPKSDPLKQVCRMILKKSSGDYGPAFSHSILELLSALCHTKKHKHNYFYIH